MNLVFEGTLALDGGILIGLALNEENFDVLENLLYRGEIILLTHELAITEMFYIICRRASINIAIEKLNYLKYSGFIAIIQIEELIKKAAEIKCKRRLALPDCFTLALAEDYNGKAVSVKAEKEILEELKRETFNVDPIFIHDRKIIKKEIIK